jgi:DNA-binding MarR family transcriptional regulator
MEPDQDPHEIAANLSRKPHRILIAIQSRGGAAKTSAITEDTDLDGSTVNYHYKGLMNANLIERTDDDPGDGIPREGYTYQITDRGKEVLKSAQEDYGLDPLEESVVRRRFDDLEARMSATEELVHNQSGGEKSQSDGDQEELEERVESLERHMDDLQEDFETLVKKVRKMVEKR